MNLNTYYLQLHIFLPLESQKMPHLFPASAMWADKPAGAAGLRLRRHPEEMKLFHPFCPAQKLCLMQRQLWCPPCTSTTRGIAADKILRHFTNRVFMNVHAIHGILSLRSSDSTRKVKKPCQLPSYTQTRSLHF